MSQVNMFSAICLQLLLLICVASSSPVADADTPVGRTDFLSARRRCTNHRTPRSADAQVQYAVVIDAGSSGSRVRIYRWKDNGGRALMTGIRSVKPTLKIQIGLAEVADNETAVRDHIERLIHNASGHIPPSHHDDTPIYFMATAGWCQNSVYLHRNHRPSVLLAVVL